MSVRNKRMLSNLVYYTLAILALASVAFFVYCLTVREVQAWAKVIYYVWAGLVVGIVIFDIICTNSKEAKTVSGLVVYILSLAAIAMSVILYFVNFGFTAPATDVFLLFSSVTFVSFLVTGFTIATWCVGESVVEHATAEDEIKQTTK